MPEHTMVWAPGSTLSSGMVTTALNLPFWPTVAEPRLIPSGCRVNVTVDPGFQCLPLTVTWSPGLIVVSLTWQVGFLGGYFWADAGAATSPTSRAIRRADIEIAASFFIDLSRRISSSWRIEP